MSCSQVGWWLFSFFFPVMKMPFLPQFSGLSCCSFPWFGSNPMLIPLKFHCSSELVYHVGFDLFALLVFANLVFTCCLFHINLDYCLILNYSNHYTFFLTSSWKGKHQSKIAFFWNYLCLTVTHASFQHIFSPQINCITHVMHQIIYLCIVNFSYI